LKKVLLLFAAGLIFVFCSLPFYWAIVTSLKGSADLFRVEFVPPRLSGANYAQVFSQQPFARNLLNSAFTALLTVFLSSFAAVLAAFPLARRSFRGRRLLLLTFLMISIFPQISLLSGLFELIRALGLYNNLLGLALVYMIFTLPFSAWTLSVFMRELPKELEEAALLDGASSWTLVRRIFVPVMAPSLVTTALLAFVAAWNEFLFALTFTLSEKSRTVPVAIAFLSGASEHELPWGAIMAASVIVTVPLVLLVLIFQCRIVAGLTAGALKG